MRPPVFPPHMNRAPPQPPQMAPPMGPPGYPPQMGLGGQPELVVTPEMEAVYSRVTKVVDTLIHIINHKKGSLNNWLLKSITPKIDVLNKQMADKRWTPEFLKKMDGLIKQIEDLGIYTNDNLVASAASLDKIRHEGDAIVATRPVGTEIETWIGAIYSLLKIALH